MTSGGTDEASGHCVLQRLSLKALPPLLTRPFFLSLFLTPPTPPRTLSQLPSLSGAPRNVLIPDRVEMPQV